jgi:hypothetical protein
MSNLCRGPSKDASYQIIGSFGKAVSEEKIIKKSTNQKKELPVTAICLLTDHVEMGNIYRGASIDVSYQVSVHLGKWFQR